MRYLVLLALLVLAGCNMKMKEAVTTTQQVATVVELQDSTRTTTTTTLDTLVSLPADSVRTGLQLAGYPNLDSFFVQEVETPRTRLRLRYNPARRSLEAVATARPLQLQLQATQQTVTQNRVKAKGTTTTNLTINRKGKTKDGSAWLQPVATGFAVSFTLATLFLCLYLILTRKKKSDAAN